MAERPFASRLWYEFLRRVLQLAAVLLYRVRHTGYHNIPRTGGVLVVSNHQSVMDPPLVGMGCPRRMNYLARETLFRFGPFRWLITSLDAIPIDREGVRLAGIKESLRRLKRGEMVLMFPEGTCRWLWRAHSRPGPVAAGFRGPGWSTCITASRFCRKISPAGTNCAWWPRWNNECAGVMRFSGAGRWWPGWQSPGSEVASPSPKT